MLNIGPQELILVLIIALVVVGPNRLPELGRTIGRALREFRKIQDDVKDTIKFDLSDDGPHVPPTKHPRTVPGNGETGKEGTPPPAPAPPEAGSEPEIGPQIETDGGAEPRAAE
jgi:sec-independent protein translocase protein TatA